MKERERNKKIAVDLKWICHAFKNLYKILHLVKTKQLKKKNTTKIIVHSDDEDIID